MLVGLARPGEFLPDWYATIKAAVFMHVPPWDLVSDVDVPKVFWQEWALMVQAADANVEVYFRAKAQRDARFHQRLGV